MVFSMEGPRTANRIRPEPFRGNVCSNETSRSRWTAPGPGANEFRVAGVGQADVVADLGALVEFQQRIVHRLHSVLAAGLNLRVNEMSLFFADVLATAAVAMQTSVASARPCPSRPLDSLGGRRRGRPSSPASGKQSSWSERLHERA